MSSTSPVRVRIAPSPTGDPHVGTAYIGLFNMVFARRHGGQFILRIEDTDQKRSSPESEQAINDYLRWVGIEWDEGPDKGGPKGPYRQSERADIYRQHASKLLDTGAAYRCFCTPERLTEMRAEQRKGGGNIGYDRRCRALDPSEAESRIQEGLAFTVRMKMPVDGETVIEDALRGTIHYPNQQIDDQVLLKSDGFPTYHLANVVDDHLMEITHVIRAEEWIPSTPKHLVLYQAFGWEPPIFVHLSLLRNPDRSKISKRKNPVSLEWYREAGFLPQALLNFLALMGWSMQDERECFSCEELISEFDLQRLKVTEPVFDLQKLEWLNSQWMRLLTPEQLAGEIRGFMTEDRLTQILPLIHERLHRLDGFCDLTNYFFAMDIPFPIDQLKIKRWPTQESDGDDPTAALRALNKALKGLLEEIETLPALEAEDLERRLRDFCERTGWRTKELFMATRLVATGRSASPPLFETMEVLGKARIQYRFRRAIEALRVAIKK